MRLRLLGESAATRKGGMHKESGENLTLDILLVVDFFKSR